jgi:hypothetical protein
MVCQLGIVCRLCLWQFPRVRACPHFVSMGWMCDSNRGSAKQCHDAGSEARSPALFHRLLQLAANWRDEESVGDFGVDSQDSLSGRLLRFGKLLKQPALGLNRIGGERAGLHGAKRLFGKPN